MCGQTATTCAVSAVPAVVHSEGLTEQMGDINLLCTGTPGAPVTGSLTVYLPINITNRIGSNGYSTDAMLNIVSGNTIVNSGVSGLVTNQSISFNGFQFTFPASGSVSVVVNDLRADANQLGLQQNNPIVAYLSSSLQIENNPVIVAFAQQGLLATSMDSGVTCVGSAAPSTVSLTNLFSAGTAEQTTRITEGFPTSFQPKDPTSDTGTRFLLTYANVPSGVTIYIPDAIAGSTALLPTSGGDLGTAVAVGQYVPGSHTLLLVRVLNTDANGVGGTFATLPAPNPSGVVVLDGANAVPLSNGAGYAVYEVVDADPSATEHAQIPNFFAVPSHTTPGASTGSVSLAPISTVTTATATDPIPRFAAVTPPSDCTAAGDCSASYYPELQATARYPLQATAAAGSGQVAAGTIQVKNIRGGVLGWTASITYTTGSGWASVSPSFGLDSGLIVAFVNPSSLQPGTYQASVVIDGGPSAGTQTIPLTLTVTAPASSVIVTGITDSADFRQAPVVPGSFASVWGSNLAGQNVSVTFNSIAAQLLYTGAQQINLRVPPSLSGQTSAQMVVTVNGVASSPYTVQLAAIAPAIFTPGVLNQDNSINSTGNPAAPGSVLQIFGTGMPDSGGTFTATIPNHPSMVPMYAGAAPGIPGMQQVNVALPSDLQGDTVNLTICVTGAANKQYCSQPEAIALKP